MVDSWCLKFARHSLGSLRGKEGRSGPCPGGGHRFQEQTGIRRVRRGVSGASSESLLYALTSVVR